MKYLWSGKFWPAQKIIQQIASVFINLFIKIGESLVDAFQWEHDSCLDRQVANTT